MKHFILQKKIIFDNLVSNQCLKQGHFQDLLACRKETIYIV